MQRHVMALSIIALATFPPSVKALDLEITGTFNMDIAVGTTSPSLAAIVGNDNSWSLSLQDVQFVCDPSNCLGPETMRQHILASSMSFQFYGPDAAVLNAEVGQHFTHGALSPHSAFLSVDSGSCYGVHDIWFYIWPDDIAANVYMQVNAQAPLGTFSTDLNECPIIESFQASASEVVFFDFRGDYEANIVDLDSGTIAIEAPVSTQEGSWGQIKAIYR